jgi:8-oxo-dGTP pyrophosphatase MutT (NUDIX family)
MNKTNSSNNCNNCGKPGHQFHQCKMPITSHGIVLFRFTSEYGMQYLMIRRKNSFGYIDLIRGKYVPTNIDHLRVMFDEMSLNERNNILKNNFETLWKDMWGETNISNQYKSEEISSQKKFELLRTGIMIDGEIITLEKLVNESNTIWSEAEWEFPKGRRNFLEKDLDCALREFEEETGISKINISVIENILPFEEIFIGSNHKSYKHKYFLAYTDKINESIDNFQRTEVSKLEWKTFEECLESIRPYNLEKKNIIKNINKVLEEYRLYV